MTLIILFGPPAVGKMTVGFELEKLTGLPLFHNHMTIDPVLRFFPFGSPQFNRLVHEFRVRICEEVAASDLPGMIFTFVWGIDLPSDKRFIDKLCTIFAGADICFVELAADQEERLRRNATELRLAEKRPKRDIEASRENLLHLDASYQLNTDGDFFYPERHLRIDNTDLLPQEVARMIVERFELPLVSRE